MIRLPSLGLLERVRIQIQGFSDELEFQMMVSVADYPYEDRIALQSAREMHQMGRLPGAKQDYLRSLELGPRNGKAALELAQLLLQQENLDSAERWALLAAANGESEQASDFLRLIYQAGNSDFPEQAAQLRAAAADWPDGNHYGAVCLDMSRKYWLGHSQWHLYKSHSIIEIRRAAAARLVRQLRFGFKANNEVIVFARVRILRGEAPIKTLADENFVVLDDPDHDESIRVAEQKIAAFLLPDLEKGDIISFEYSIVQNNRKLSNGQPDFYIMAGLLSAYPTFQSRTEFRYPKDWAVKCHSLHGAPPPKKMSSDDEWETVSVSAEHLISRSWGVSDFERMADHPLICCSWDNRTWDDVGREMIKTIKITDPLEPIPLILREVIEDVEPTIRQLAAGFNWIRDRLKYTSFISAKKRSGQKGRAEAIVQAGVADCDDRTYLLYLLCHELNLEAEFVLISENNGYIVKEFPGGKFDHILLRVKHEDEWLYLDATDIATPFGYSPFYLQGLPALCLNDKTEINEIPENNPGLNSFFISETLLCGEDGTLEGEFYISASGTLARFCDDHWKSLSMGAPDLDAAAQIVLRSFLPRSELKEWQVGSPPGRTGAFTFRGSHRRQKTNEIGPAGVVSLTWNPLLFPWQDLRQRRWDKVAMLFTPFVITVGVEIDDQDKWKIQSSRFEPEEKADFGSIYEKQAIEGTKHKINRIFQLDKRIVRGVAVKDIPRFLDRFGEALQLSLLISRVE